MRPANLDGLAWAWRSLAKRALLGCAVSAALLTILGGSAGAAPITLDATASGWWEGATHSAFPPGGISHNYFAGWTSINPAERRNYFVFDFSAVAVPITSAVLRVQTYTYASPDLTETYAVYDVTTSIAALTAGGSGQSAIFNDLGTGNAYGSRVFSVADGGLPVDIVLNAQALADLNAALGGQFALGGAVTTLSGQMALNEGVFANSHSGGTRQLLLNLPEPATAALLGLGLVGLAWQGRRRRVSNLSLRFVRLADPGAHVASAALAVLSLMVGLTVFPEHSHALTVTIALGGQAAPDANGTFLNFFFPRPERRGAGGVSRHFDRHQRREQRQQRHLPRRRRRRHTDRPRGAGRPRRERHLLQLLRAPP